MYTQQLTELFNQHMQGKGSPLYRGFLETELNMLQDLEQAVYWYKQSREANMAPNMLSWERQVMKYVAKMDAFRSAIENDTNPAANTFFSGGHSKLGFIYGALDALSPADRLDGAKVLLALTPLVETYVRPVRQFNTPAKKAEAVVVDIQTPTQMNRGTPAHVQPHILLPLARTGY